MGANWYTGVNPSTPVYTINFNGLQERRAAFGVRTLGTDGRASDCLDIDSG
jgi:hypothetical protein